MKILSICLILICLSFCLAPLYAQWTVPRQVFQEVLEYGSSYPDSLIYPEEGTISIKVFIASRPEQFLTEEHNSTYAQKMNGIFLIMFNLGNIAPLTGGTRDWAFGDTVRMEVLHKPTGRTAATEFEIPAGSSAIFRRGKDAIVLSEPAETDEKNSQ